MAFETGTATDQSDLFTKLIAFLTTNSTLVGLGQEWAVAWSLGGGSTDVILRGPGLSVTDTVFVSLQEYGDAINDNFWISVRGMSGINPLVGSSVTDHVNVSTDVRIFTDNAPMQYWFVANGRRFIVVLKISTVFESLYAGLFLPYATPISYPYPMFIGGSAASFSTTYAPPMNWRSLSDNHRHFMWSRGAGGLAPQGPQAFMIDPMGQWLTCAQGYAVGIWPDHTGQAAYYMSTDGNNFWNNYFGNFREGFGGDYALLPAVLTSASPADQTWGILDGAYRISGYDRSSQDLITKDGVDHLVVQNVFRTGGSDYWALRLE